MALYLGGGGSPEQAIEIEGAFFRSLTTTSRILYIPIALKGSRPLDQCIDWFASLSERYGRKHFQVLRGFDQEPEPYDAIYIGGGNTFTLLSELRGSKFEDDLKASISDGVPVFGGSAGAAIFGASISTVEHIDQNAVGITDLRGLDLVPPYSIWVHYTEQDDKLIEANGTPIVALTEESGIVVNNGIRKIGRVSFFHEIGT